MRTFCLALLLALAPPATAGTPALQLQQAGSVNLAVPGGWVAAQTAPSTWMAQESANPGAPTLVLMTVPAAQGPNAAQQLVLGALPDARGLQSLTQADGSVLHVYEGQAGRIALITAVDAQQSTAFIAAFGAPTSRFEALGGVELVRAFAAQSHPAQAQTTTMATAPQAAGPAVPLAVLAEQFEQLPPAQVASSLRQLSPSDTTLLTVYPAFAGLLHAVGCQADPSLPLPTASGPISCAHTMHQWQSTYQLVGSWEAAFQQALSERSTYLIGARCSSGAHSAQDCAAYTSAMSQYSAMSHETSMRIISNMSPDGCLIGDPGCVPY